MLYERTYLDKVATIIKDSDINTGINSVAELLWGRNTSRMLLHFDESKIKCLVDDKTYPDITKLHHVLKMTNAGSPDVKELHKCYNSSIDGERKHRTSSFDLMFFLIPFDWDRGKGFDFTVKQDLNNLYTESSAVSREGVNWFQYRTGYNWKRSSEDNNRTTKDRNFIFNISSDKILLNSEGGDVVLSYNCSYDNVYLNHKLELVEVVSSGCTIHEQVYLNENGNICETEESKKETCKLVKQVISIPENKSGELQKFSFRVICTVDGKKYQSNPYTIEQESFEYAIPLTTDDGIYTTDTLNEEYVKYLNGEDSAVIGIQHFDIGNENIDIDITDIVNKFISGDIVNNGIGVAFIPKYENELSDEENYVGFFTDKTNTFFEPYLETTYEDVISDDRANFILGKTNRLYLYANIGGNLVNLDEIPTCKVNETEYEVKQASKGTYYIEIKLPYNAFTAPTMLYDTWTNIIYQGENLGPVELDFTTKSPSVFFKVGTSLPEQNAFTPTIYGVKDAEAIKRGDLRKICVLFRNNYSQNKSTVIDDVEIRLYVKDGTAENDVVSFTTMDKTFDETYFLLDTNILIPNTYYIDIRVRYGMESVIHHDVSHFKIVNDLNNKFA